VNWRVHEWMIVEATLMLCGFLATEHAIINRALFPLLEFLSISSKTSNKESNVENWRCEVWFWILPKLPRPKSLARAMLFVFERDTSEWAGLSIG
jgi:hypothetical protein